MNKQTEVINLEKLFLTGASGCVGHYLLDELAGNYELYMIVRNPAKLRFEPAALPAVHLIPDDLENISSHAELLSQMDFCIHAATSWGGDAAERINVQRTHKLFSLLSPSRIKRVIYFSTASVLGNGNRLLPEAGSLGTDYVKSKYNCYRSLSQSPVAEKTVTVFPTLVFGGDSKHPASHLSSGLPAARRYSRLLGHLNIDAAFHFIHAQDIARIVAHLLQMENPAPNYVLGNAPLSFREFVTRTAKYFGHNPHWQITFSPKWLYRLGTVLGAKMSPWDRFCLEYKDFRYQTVNCHTFNLPTKYSTVEEVLGDWHLIPC